MLGIKGKTKTVNKRSNPFRETRAHHSNEAAEDYTELVADLIELKGEARICDIARQLGISHVTAIRTTRRLRQLGYLNADESKPISLTKKGKATARYCKRRHNLLLRFLIGLGVPKTVAEIDVEGMEHHISHVSLRAIEKNLKH